MGRRSPSDGPFVYQFSSHFGKPKRLIHSSPPSARRRAGPNPGASSKQAEGGVMALLPSHTGHRRERVEGSTLNGIPGQGTEVRRLWNRFYFHGRGATVFSRQTVQERAQTLQGVQSEACFGAWRGTRARRQQYVREGGNSHHVFAMREGNHGALQADSGPSRFLPGVFSRTPASGYRLGRSLLPRIYHSRVDLER